MKSIDILWSKEETVVEETVVEKTEKVTSIGIGSVLSDGYIIYSETETEWLAVAPANKRADYTWGSSGTARGVTSSTDGYKNTLIRIFPGVQNAAHYAWYNNPTLDSYLPSKDELDTIYENKELIDAADTSSGEFTLAAIGAGTAVRPNAGGRVAVVWSSTEFGTMCWWGRNFYNGDRVFFNKNDSYWVVPMRRITKTEE